MVHIPIHTNDEGFQSLMKRAAKALRTKNGKLLGKVKKEFAKGDISLFYNKGTDVIRVLRKDAPPIDFPASNWTKIPKK